MKIPGLAMGLVLAFTLLALPAAAVDTTYPILDNQVTVRQAHLAWQAAVYETKMQATIDYLASLSGDTARLSSILSQFQSEAGQVSSVNTHVGLNTLLRELSDLVRQFKAETRIQLVATKGKPAELLAKIDEAVKNNPELATLEANYWSERETDRLENHRIRVDRAQKVLDALKGRGYDTGAAQATLDQIRGMERELADALASRDNARIQAVNRAIADLWRTLIQQVRDLQVQVPEGSRVSYWIHVGERIMGRVDLINNDLETLGVDTSTLDPLITAAKGDLSAARSASSSGDLAGAKTYLQAFREDLKDLRDAYRSLLSVGAVTGKAAESVESLAAALDSTITQMEDM
jgi:hypothetical protein